MTDTTADLARRFARTLEQLRTTYDVQYVSTRPLPEPAPIDEPSDAFLSVTDASASPGPQPTPSSPGPQPTPSSPGPQPTPASSDPQAASLTSLSGSSDARATASEHRASSASSSREHQASTDSRSLASASEPRASGAAFAPAPNARTATHTPTLASTPTPSPTSIAPPVATSHPVARERDLFAPSDPVPPPAAAAAAAAADDDDEDQARRRSLREQAQLWTPAKKLEYLRVHNVGDCQRCPLARTRTRIVFGVGNPEADVMFVGEAPGADEDRQGEPFVGRAGQLLNQWLVQLGLRREDVYIGNVLKCRPPGNRDPRPEEVERCSPFLQAQIRAIEPKVIVALGRHAGMLLSGRDELTLRAMRQGRLHYDAGAAKGEAKARMLIPLVVTYHPAYVLRQEGDGRTPAVPGRPSATDMVMTDLRRALSIARGDAPPR